MNILIILFLSLTFGFAKKDFYYSFIDENKVQMEQYKKNKISQGNDKLSYIKRLVREGQLLDAYKDIIKFKEENKIQVLNSSIEILYSEILYKRGSKKFAIKGAKTLETAINKGIINESDLVDALKLLVKLEIKINKIKEAKFYATSIVESFDDPLSSAYGEIAEAQIATHRRKYKKAINILYKILVKTKNISVATVVADELYDVYVLNGQNEKAYDLASKVLKRNIAYYANDSFLALKKVDKLIRANMPHLAIQILEMLLNNAKQKKSIDTFKFKLANAYMSVKTVKTKYILEAKELYKDLISSKQDNAYKKRAKMYIDEILMREGKLSPSLIVRKYPHSDPMQEKSLMQELLNQAALHKYDKINKVKKIYRKISIVTARRYGYTDIKELFTTIDSDMIKYYLKDDRCLELSKVLTKIDIKALKRIITDNKSNKKMFNCMLEYPSKTTFNIASKAFANSKNGAIYLYLEKIALQLDLNDEAYKLSQKIDMVTIDKEKTKSAEFLYKFLIYGKLNNKFSMEKFFSYASRHTQYIKDNKNEPLIIDFYYQYYLYLIDKNKEKQAVGILKKLYNAQKEMDAFIYSPFVEMKLSLEQKLDDDYEGALKYLELALDNPRNIKANDLVQIYFEMAKIYKKLGKQNRYKYMIDKCKDVKGANSLYKKMCDRS